MNLRPRLFVASSLLFASAAVALFAFSSATGAGIENPTCEQIGSGVYRLDYQPGRGVVILPLWPELPAAKNNMHLPAS